MNLKVGDVITLDQYSTDPVKVFVEGVLKFKSHPENFKGNQAVKITAILQDKLGIDHGTE